MSTSTARLQKGPPAHPSDWDLYTNFHFADNDTTVTTGDVIVTGGESNAFEDFVIQGIHISGNGGALQGIIQLYLDDGADEHFIISVAAAPGGSFQAWRDNLHLNWPRGVEIRRNVATATSIARLNVVVWGYKGSFADDKNWSQGFGVTGAIAGLEDGF